MLRINLLPPYIYAGNKRRNVVVLWVVLLVGTIGGFVYGKVTLNRQAADFVQRATDLEPTATEADNTQAKATKLIADTADTKKKRDFVKDSIEYNSTTYPSVFNNVRDWTIRSTVYSSIVPLDKDVTANAYVPSLASVGHYMMTMEQNPNISNVLLTVDSVPGFPPGATNKNGQGGGGQKFGGQGGNNGNNTPSVATLLRPPGHDFVAKLTLVNPIKPSPAYGGGGGTGDNGGAGNNGGPFGGGGPVNGGQKGMPGSGKLGGG